jgi:SEC-C motif domain protein
MRYSLRKSKYVSSVVMEMFLLLVIVTLIIWQSQAWISQNRVQRIRNMAVVMAEGFGREPSPLNIPNSGKSPRRKKRYWEQQNEKVRDKSKNKNYVYVKMKGHSSIGDGRAKLGFKHMVEEALDKPKPPSPTDPCGCGSGSRYRQCCGSLHQTLIDNNNDFSPEQVLRARYTAHKYGLTQYIIESSHPKNPDFIYHMEESKATRNSGTKRWKRDIMTMTELYSFEGIEVVDVKTEGDVSSIIFRTLLQEHNEDANYVPVEENAVFLRAGGRWLYHDGETSPAAPSVL